MMLDSLLQLADAVTTTTTSASTNVIDLAERASSEKECWFVFNVPTAWTQAGSNTIKLEVQTSEAEGFGGDASDETLVASGTIAVSSLVAGYSWKTRIPFGRKRYLRGYLTVTGNSGANYITAAKYDMNIVMDADMEKKYA